MKSSNTCPEHRNFYWLCLRLFFAAPALLGAVHITGAAEVKKLPVRYTRTQWSAGSGLPGGEVHAITQTADGYLWIGTETGLIRFDGLQFQLTREAAVAEGSAGPILGLATDSQGNLVVRRQSPILETYRKGLLQTIPLNLSGAHIVFTAMSKGKDGQILLSTLTHGTLQFDRGVFSVLAAPSHLPNFLAISIAQTADGRIWVGSRDAGLFQMKDGGVLPVAPGARDRKINCLLPANDHDLWMGTDNGIVRWNGTDFNDWGLPASLRHLQVLAMLQDRAANIWVGTSEGLFRIDPQNGSTFFPSERRLHKAVNALYEDREGNIWVGTTGGIERLRETAFTTYSATELLPAEMNGPLYVDEEGRTWFAPSSGGLDWLQDGQVRRVASEDLDRDVVYSVTGGKGEVWVGRQRGGLTRLTSKNGGTLARTFTEADGLAQNSVYALNLNRDGTLWAGTLNGGASKLAGGHFTTYTASEGLLSGTVFSIHEGADGTMWFGTPNGLSAFSDGRWKSFTVREGLPSNDVNCVAQDRAGTVWVGTGQGLAAVSDGRVTIPPSLPKALRESVLGVALDQNGMLWMATSGHVLRADPRKLLSVAGSGEAVREFENADGLPGMEGVKRNQTVVADSRGQIWYSVGGAISVVDPAQADKISQPAIPSIEELSADGKPVNLEEGARISANPQRVVLRFTGLSLSVPERVRFRYKLDRFDENWSEPVDAREAIYTNLNSGSYRFRVIASNSDGIWNSQEATVAFEIERVFWQTWWFRLSSVVVIGLAALLFFRIRVVRLTRQMNMRFDERLAERTRIAQELHDTLLQGFLSASMQLHVADDQLESSSPAKPLIGRVLQLMRRVIEEGRNAVKGLRYSTQDGRDLAEAFSQVQQEVGGTPSVEVRIIVEGTLRPLRPMLRDEVYLIGREALVNAFRHARASSVEVELDYGGDHLRLLVRDNGQGIDEDVLRSGREGHWGLSGMRERAERIGAKLKVLSRAAAGTEVELSVPARIAFESSDPSRSQRWFKKLRRRDRVESGESGNERPS